MTSVQPRVHKVQDRLKRTIDVVLGGAALLLLFPLLASISVIVRVALGSPVFFRQTRPGCRGIPFTMYKFRTMRDAYDAQGKVLSDAERLTKVGRWLRESSLDELPELINVMKGEMSLVGPRPLLMEYLALYTDQQARRHEVRPGITGWAQVNGRNALDWERRFELDVWYVDNRSLKLDIVILWRTIARVLKRDGISQPGEATVRRYGGGATE